MVSLHSQPERYVLKLHADAHAKRWPKVVTVVVGHRVSAHDWQALRAMVQLQDDAAEI